MRQLKNDTVIGVILVLIVGTLSHFIYEWTGKNLIVGFLTPVNESTWEHMKLVFFPMLFYSFVMNKNLKQNFPCITSSLAFGILLGTLLIPAIFYTYTAILGDHVFILDLLTFALSVIIAFFVIYKLTLSCKLIKYTFLLCILLFIIIICFFLFTYFPPNIKLFSE